VAVHEVVPELHSGVFCKDRRIQPRQLATRKPDLADYTRPG